MSKLPLPLKAVSSPKKRKSTGTSEPASKKRRLVSAAKSSYTESLTGYSSYHFNRLLHQLPEHNGVKKFTSNEVCQFIQASTVEPPYNGRSIYIGFIQCSHYI